jgi:MoaA/NifB/PqqE/SkfB family radical SAM enzyme
MSMSQTIIPRPRNNALNEMSVQGIVMDTITPQCNRAKLNTGTFCNYDCEFCYYTDLLDVKTPFEVVKERADYLRDYGITEVDLSGGESSVSPDWFRILDYCNENFEHVSCLSHGGRFSNIEFLKESQDHGLKEILFSLHGATSEAHDTITRRKGSFNRIVQAIKNAKELGIIVRINSTVYYKNYFQLANEYADLINELDPLEVNFITLNYWEGVRIEKENVTYADMTEQIKRCIDRLNKKIVINVRFVPYCYMEGYEKYVCDQYQHIYDPWDWNRAMLTDEFDPDIDTTKTYSEEEKLAFAHKQCASHRNRFYRKELSCLKCKYFYICDGIENEIAGTPVYPVDGEKIKEVTFFRKDHFK